MTETVVAYTPNGREIRQTEAGTYVVQPHNDNYWIECRSVQEAMYRYHFPNGEFKEEEEYYPCAWCEGDGTIDGVECSHCDGTGEASDD